jgi:hypothetical protein
LMFIYANIQSMTLDACVLGPAWCIGCVSEQELVNVKTTRRRDRVTAAD